MFTRVSGRPWSRTRRPETRCCARRAGSFSTVLGSCCVTGKPKRNLKTDPLSPGANQRPPFFKLTKVLGLPRRLGGGAGTASPKRSHENTLTDQDFINAI